MEVLWGHLACIVPTLSAGQWGKAAHEASDGSCKPAAAQYDILCPAQIAPGGYSRQPQQQPAALQSCQQLVAFLEPVHAAGFAHRDICLDNKGPVGGYS